MELVYKVAIFRFKIWESMILVSVLLNGIRQQLDQASAQTII